MACNSIISVEMSGAYSAFRDKLRLTMPPFDCTGIPGTDCYCDDLAYQSLSDRLKSVGPAGVHLIDSGNYHYLTLLFLDKIPAAIDITLILFDNHPDSKEPAFGEIISCGGWVRKAVFMNKNIKKILMIGTDPTLLADEADHIISENNETVSFSIGASEAVITSAKQSTPECRQKLLADNLKDNDNCYISFDLDCLSERDANCNWSQGNMTIKEAGTLLGFIRKNARPIGMDICGACAADESDKNEKNIKAINALIDNYYLVPNILSPASPRPGQI